jgi:RP/EB family microtubule-associated protein
LSAIVASRNSLIHSLPTCLRSDFEFVGNYKLLQVAFNKHRVQRHVDVDKLIRAKYQDNLEFCQWLKAFHDQSGATRDNYDPLEARARGKGGKKYNEMLEKAGGAHGSRPTPNKGPRTPITAASLPRKPKPAAPPVRPAAPAARPVPRVANARPTTTAPKPKPTRPGPTTARTGPGAKPRAPLKESASNKADAAIADATLMKKNAEMSTKVVDLETSVRELEKERDFYFTKLRNVELMLQVQQDKGWDGCDLHGVVDSIFKVLYATAENDVAVGENGEVTYTLKSPYFKPGRLLKLTCSYRVTVQIIPAEAVDSGLDISDVESTAVDTALDVSAVASEGADENAAVPDEELAF